MTQETREVFVTGATGYIGGRLVPLLLASGYHVRCLARDPKKLESRSWFGDPRVSVVSGSIESEHLAEAIQYRSLDRKLWMGG